MRPVEFPSFLQPLVHELVDLTSGYAPDVKISSDAKDIGSAYFDGLTLFPTVVVPADSDGPWDQVAFGLIHLIRSQRGIPELKNAKKGPLETIAQDVNQELERTAANHEAAVRGLPQRKIEVSLPAQMLEFLTKCEGDTSAQLIIFRAMQLALRDFADQVALRDVVSKFRKIRPQEAREGFALAKQLNSCPLRTPHDKASVSVWLLQRLGIDPEGFYLQTIQTGIGTKRIFDLGYYERQSSRHQWAAGRMKDNFTEIILTLPFRIPVEEGVYATSGNLVVLDQVEISDPRASFKTSQFVKVDPQIEQPGLYWRTKAKIVLKGQLSWDCRSVPSEKVYLFFRSCPEVIIEAVKVMNDLIAWARTRQNRPEIPDVSLLHFNSYSLRQVDTSGHVVVDVPMQSLEPVRVYIGRLGYRSLEHQSIEVSSIALSDVLLNQAKRHLIEFNLRHAVLDLYGAFESFVADYIKPLCNCGPETTLTRFLSMYGGSFSPAVRTEVEKLKDINDSREPSVQRVVRQFKKLEIVKGLNESLDKVLAVANYRNDAAHGRALPPQIADLLGEGIAGLEDLISQSDSLRLAFQAGRIG